MIDILLWANVETTDYHIRKMYETLGSRNAKNYHRLMSSLKNASPEMDNVSSKNIYELIQACLAYVDQYRNELNDIAKSLSSMLKILF